MSENSVINGMTGSKPSLDDITDSIQLGNKQLWDEIYQLVRSGADKYVDMPQIIVVGGQSSGKSSVLEAITGYPFPRVGQMCTKFPTQISLRNSDRVESKKVAIIPAPDSKIDRELAAAFGESMRKETDLGVIIDAAEKTIWPDGGSSSHVSKDTLSLEFTGITKAHLTVVDLPGIIHTGMTEDDCRAITDLTIEYMKNPRSIIVAVIEATTDVANQTILQLAKEIDPKGLRTLGVITKPDRIQSSEDRTAFMQLAKNEKAHLELGWHVLRNRSGLAKEKNSLLDERNRIEKEFFSTLPWAELPPNQLGIKELIDKLRRLLVQHIGSVIPQVKADIQRKLLKCNQELDQLGKGYESVEDMRKQMQAWCQISKDYIKAAHEGDGYRDDYKRPFFQKNPNIRKLRARINQQNIQFNNDMKLYGHTVEIITNGNETTERSKYDGHAGELIIETMKVDQFIHERIDPVFDHSAGKEVIGESNPLLIFEFFKKQSENWRHLAEYYRKEIFDLCDLFIEEVLEEFWPKNLHAEIGSLLVEKSFKQREQKAEEELKNYMG
ncbi:hypothetical protein VE04_10154 [Pseudogymnoascus sp. 24MN13]|nr:hypothetical protein VE04_10154 [Pseudogymnoascus sp. 24MN13]